MLKIRLSRIGKRNRASFRVTVSDSRRAPNGKFIEILGHYDPLTKEKSFNKERIEYWISKGAQASPTIHNFLIDAGIVKGEKVMAWKPKKKEETKGNKAETPAAAKTEAKPAAEVKK